jgi:murein peptide amidase A
VRRRRFGGARAGSITAAVGSAALLAAWAGCTASATDIFAADLATSASSHHTNRPAVVSSRILGDSVKSHPIRAYELGNPKAAVTVVALGAIHGNETGGTTILSDLRDGARVRGVHLWVIPRANPDGVLRGDRHNAHGVDLNRNFATKWAPLTGWYYSGPRPWSEPETRALRRFLNDINPDYVVSFHSPFHSVDVHGSKDRPFARRLAHDLNLAIQSVTCSGLCHGTLGQWFDAHHAGAAVTAELGASPSWRYLHVKAPRGLLRAIGGRF